MKQVYLAILLLAAIFIGLFQCVYSLDLGAACSHHVDHEEIRHSYQTYSEGEDRRKRSATPPPLRIAVHYDSSFDNQSVEFQQFIKNGVMPAALDFLSNTLSPKIPLTDPIIFNRDCSGSHYVTPEVERPCVDTCQAMTTCIRATIPEEHLRRCTECNGNFETCNSTGEDGPGVSDADFILYVSSLEVGSCGPDSSTLAFAGACEMEQRLDRPIAGGVNFCQRAQSGDRPFEELLQLTLHELTHALVFSSSLFPYFRNPDGTPQTARDESGSPRDENNNIFIGNNTVRTITYTDWETNVGIISHNVTALVTPTILEQGAIHYGCDNFFGAELESQDTGSGLAPSHWEIRTFGNEFMTPILQDNGPVSRLSLALFNDSGWYNVDFSQAQEMAWGRLLGCRFSHGSCGEWINGRVESGMSLHPFCNMLNSQEFRCRGDRLGYGVCDLVEFQSEIPSFYEYFNITSWGGSFFRGDYCPTNRPAYGMCSDTSLLLTNNVIAATYSPTSRCVETGAWNLTTESNIFTFDSFRAGCYEYSCSRDTGLTISVLGNDFQCTNKDQVINIDITVNGSRYQGSLICPSCEEICYDEIHSCPGICAMDCQNGGRCLGNDFCDCTGTGAEGELCETDIDECIVCDGVCGPGNCTNLPAGMFYTCSCPAATVLSGSSHNNTLTCVVDEGCNGFVCDARASCTNISGSYECVCNTGYSGNGTVCIDINECVFGIFPCDVNADCINTEGSFNCMCAQGYSGNGTFCADINECQLGVANCGTNASCTNTEGSYYCMCNQGYSGNGTVCTDINECELVNSPCGTNATCTNTEGSYYCMCNQGYSGNGTVCIDINECELGTSPCGTNATCTNTNGSYYCMCNQGYSGNGTVCIDINECELGNSPCGTNATCTNTEGSYYCICSQGYSGNGTVCIDINECESGTSPCGSNATCINTNGSYYCMCNEGYSGNGITCVDINECEVSPCDANANCININGSFNCVCNQGYIGNGITCVDINECEVSPCDANADCININGSFNCVCNQGYIGNGITCVDINECEVSPCDANANCININGSFNCVCNQGYTGNGFMCTVDNTCNGSVCDPRASCRNISGSYQCVCNAGYSGNGILCNDINECETGIIPCGTNANCVNSNGSYSCVCNQGYVGDGITCTVAEIFQLPPTIINYEGECSELNTQPYRAEINEDVCQILQNYIEQN